MGKHSVFTMSLQSRRNQHFHEWVNECLSSDELSECKRLVDQLTDEDEDMTEFPELPYDMRKIRECFLVLRDSLREARREPGPTTDDARHLREQLETSRERVRQRDMEISILLSKIQDLKNTIVTMSKKQESFCANELKLNIDSVSQASYSGTGSELATPNFSTTTCRTDNSRPSTATSIYQKYSTEDRRAFLIFMSKQYSTTDNVKVLKSKLKLKYQELKDLASASERSQEKLLSLGRMLDGHRTDTETNRTSDYEAGLNGRISQEEMASTDIVSRLSEVKNEIMRLREDIEREKMQLVSKFERWKLAATNQEAEWPEETKSTEDESFLSPQSHTMGDHGDNGLESGDLSPVTSCNDGGATTFDELKIGMGDIHSRKPYRYQKHGTGTINYSNHSPRPIVTTDSCSETTHVSRASTGRSSGQLRRQDHTVGANALIKLRELRRGIEDIEKLQNKNSQLISMGMEAGDVHKHVTLCDHEKTPSVYSSSTSFEPQEEKFDDSASQSISKQNARHRNSTDLDNFQPQESIIEIDDLVLTGDPEVDEEVINFYRARNKLFF